MSTSQLENPKSQIENPTLQPSPNSPTLHPSDFTLQPSPHSPIENPAPTQLPITNPQLPSTPSSQLPITNPQLPHYIPLFPRARFSLLIGDPGTGKSLLAAHLAARASLRSLFPPKPFLPNPYPSDEELAQAPNPENSNRETPTPYPDNLDPDSPALDTPQPDAAPPGHVLYCSREDDDDTLHCRFSVAAAGTPLDNRFLFTSHNVSLVPPTFSRKHGRKDSSLLSEIKRECEQEHRSIRLLILDPLPACLESVDASHNASLIREALDPLLNYAIAHAITIVGIAHLTKNPRVRNPLFQAAHSHAYTALARSVVLLTPDTLTHNPHRRLLIPLKNAFAFPDRAFAFNIRSAPCDTADIPFPYLEFEPDPILYHPLLPTCTAPEEILEESDLQHALDFLRATLAQGPVPSSQLQSESRTLGIALRTLKRAKQRLHIHSFRTTRWFSTLPNPPEYLI